MFGLRRGRQASNANSTAVPLATDQVPATQLEAPPLPSSPRVDWEPVNALAKLLAEGKLTAAREQVTNLPPPLQDAFQQLVQSLNGQMVTQLRETSAAIELGARPLLASESLSKATEVQASGISHVAAITEELSASVEEIAASAEAAAQKASSARSQVEVGIASVGGALDGLGILDREIEALQRDVQHMQSTVGPIHEVLALIEEISDQTNLLALNAAIEAARAGEQGRGFAVVAQEVRRLAERSQRAVRDVQEKVHTLSSSASTVVTATGHLVARVRDDAQLADKGRTALREIGGALEQVVEPIQEIARATEEEAKAVQEAATNVSQISTTMAEIQRASADLAVMVSDLQGALRKARAAGDKMRLSLNDLDLLEIARADHVLWVQRLHEMVLGRERIQPGDVNDHTQCRLGKWYEQKRSGAGGLSSAFRAIDEPHHKLHATARQAVELWNQNRKTEAIALVHQVVDLSQVILARLRECAAECGAK